MPAAGRRGANLPRLALERRLPEFDLVVFALFVLSRTMSQDTIQSKKKKWHFSVEKDFLLDTRLKPMARMLYIVLMSYASPNSPVPFPGMALLAKILDCTE